MFFCIIMALINAFQLFPQVQIMTEGGPNGGYTGHAVEESTHTDLNIKMGYVSAYSLAVVCNYIHTNFNSDEITK